MIELKQECSFPGVLAVESCTGTISHGITPAAFCLITYPQTTQPQGFGTLVVGDGFRKLTLRDCKVEQIRGRAGPDGQTVILTILDRRWRWRTGAISGRYNQRDRRGKLIPWTIRSPEELARLCLEAMGEKGYKINLPPGLPAAAGANLDRYLKAGENFAQSMANPPVVWDKIPPALALAELCDRYGCRVIFQASADRVLIAPLGEGLVNLPNGPCEFIAPALEQRAVPGAVAVAGAPVRIQCRLKLEAVGRDWDGSWREINELSFAPRHAGSTQQTEVRYSAADDPDLSVTIRFNPNWKDPAPDPADDITLTFAATPGQTVEDQVVQIAAAINSPQLAGYLTALGSARSVVLFGTAAGFGFTVEADADGAPSEDLVIGTSSPPVMPGASWGTCAPPAFAGVRATDQLSYDEALRLARATVFRCYRVKFVEPDTGKPGLTLPWYGKLKRRQQLILEQTRVEQVRPVARTAGGAERDSEVAREARLKAGGVLAETYSGYSKDAKPKVLGAVAKRIGSVAWDGTSGELNTAAGSEVHVEVAGIDPAEQVVTFGEYVYQALGGARDERVAAADLTLEISVLVTDPDTNELVRWEERLALGGEAPVEWEVREDVQVGIEPTYTDGNKLEAYGIADVQDAKARAHYYLRGMAKKYELKGGETRQYIGIQLVDCDGAVLQTTFTIGEGGATTVVSTGSEHSQYVPDYPARRREENLPPNKAAAAANLAERAAWDAKLPRPK